MKELTIAINTLNDNYECGQTLKSIRETAGDKVDVIVIDDASDTPFIAPADTGKNVTIRRMDTRMGVGPTRHMAVMMANTPWVLIIDSHMRFTEGWYEKAMDRIKGRAGECIVYNATCLGLNQANMDVKKYVGEYRGATLCICDQHPGANEIEVLEGKWVGPHSEDDNEVACLMGACYFVPKELFLYVGGLKMLRMWGSDEPFLSLKVWLAGGEIRYLRPVEIGHKFRTDTGSPYVTEDWNMTYNKLMMIFTIFPQECWKHTLRHLKQDMAFKKAMEVIQLDGRIIQVEGDYMRHIFSRNLRWYCEKFGIRYPVDD